MQTQALALTDSTPKWMLWTGRVLSTIVVLFLVPDAIVKFVDLDVVTETSKQLQIPLHLLPTLGALLLAFTLLYAYPPTAVLGAILLTGYLGGAFYTHLRVGSPFFTHLFFGGYLGLMIWGGLWLRDEKLRGLFPLRRD